MPDKTCTTCKHMDVCKYNGDVRSALSDLRQTMKMDIECTIIPSDPPPGMDDRQVDEMLDRRRAEWDKHWVCFTSPAITEQLDKVLAQFCERWTL